MAEKTTKAKASKKKKTLIIVESPAKAKTIEHYLGTFSEENAVLLVFVIRLISERNVRVGIQNVAVKDGRVMTSIAVGEQSVLQVNLSNKGSDKHHV